MCNRSVTEEVKRRMAGRPAPHVATAGGSAPASSVSLVGARVIDLTHVLSEDFPTYDGPPGFASEPDYVFADGGFNGLALRIAEHTGTHIDAPLHVTAEGRSIDEVPVERLVVPLVVVDIRARADADDEAQLTPDDLKAWQAAHGDFPQNCCVAMLSGWTRHLGTPRFRNADDTGTMHFPGVHAEAAEMLLAETGAAGIAVDTLSLDIGSTTTFDAHYAWLPAGGWALEAVANLEALPSAGATMFVGAPKHRGGTGGPTRVLAVA